MVFIKNESSRRQGGRVYLYQCRYFSLSVLRAARTTSTWALQKAAADADSASDTEGHRTVGNRKQKAKYLDLWCVKLLHPIPGEKMSHVLSKVLAC